jgi:ElaA protein
MKIEWVKKKWSEVSLEEFYSVLRLRSEVFVVEQDCVYQDIDNKDQIAIHLLGYINKELIAYSRLFNE